MIRVCWSEMRQQIVFEVCIAEKRVTYLTRKEAEEAEIEGLLKYKTGDSPLFKHCMKMLTK
ncbi:MAG: hypothetical protein QM504_03780 [Pseudomonadota bacterium]